MRKAILIAIIIILYFLQVTLANSFSFFNAKPDLVLAAVVLVSLGMSFSAWPLVIGLIAGLLKDGSQAGPCAVNTFLLPLWSFLILRLARKITLEGYISRALLVFLVVLLHNLVLGLLVVYSGSFLPLGIFSRLVFLTSLYTAVLIPFLAKLIDPFIAITYLDPKDEPLNEY
jgi:rod shape-determining protein MreD